MSGLTLYDAAIMAAVVLAAVGVIVLAVELPGVFRWLSDQPEREAACLSTATAHDGGPFPGSDPLDYLDDLPFVGNAHGDRSTTRTPSLREQFAAAPIFTYDYPPSRPDDRFSEFTGSIDEFLIAQVDAELDAMLASPYVSSAQA